jgi:hypothetical protein
LPDDFQRIVPATRRSLQLRLITKIRALSGNRNAGVCRTVLCTALV